jgi:hypothetical protein
LARLVHDIDEDIKDIDSSLAPLKELMGLEA